MKTKLTIFILFGLMVLSALQGQADWTKHISNPVMDVNTIWWDSGGRADPVVITGDGLYKMWMSANDGDYTRVVYSTSTDGINWVDYGPVLDRGDSTSWDGYSLDTPHVLYDSTAGNYKMWYAAYSFDYPNYYQIGYATSPDGVTWVKYSENPVLTFSIDEASVSDPSVVKVENNYIMWYSTMGYTDIHISRATSSDGFNWIKHGAVLSGTTGEWDSLIVAMPSVIYNGTSYEMWYSGGVPEQDWMPVPPYIGYATSADGITWVKSSGNPVLKFGNDSEFDYLAVCCPTVSKTGGSYQMWYTGAGGIPIMFRIGYATAPSLMGIESTGNNVPIGKIHNFPNPFNPVTTIRYSVETPHAVSLQIFDITGRLVETLVNGELVSGEYEVVWNAGNLPSGVYFVRLQSGEFVENQKVLLIK